jgi:hypothetical protein
MMRMTRSTQSTIPLLTPIAQRSVELRITAVFAEQALMREGTPGVAGISYP